VFKFLISEFFFPFKSVVYSAPIVLKLLSEWVSTSLIAWTKVSLLSVDNSIEEIPDFSLDKFPISDCNSFIASTIVISSFLTWPKRSLPFKVLLKFGLL